ncbi:transcriptional regulator with XRE-family HTH domain [Chryseobacterium defluvii]|uniref:Transcriptional regulator with XRE-family HTH domain n=1 Tax=Chryseobacterium defluvii TaxID=160396 RepID=A0A840KFF4_9FLAO|nr:helix-turn-helix domain-containing protein [Chryseobacterium defluvii]MBB4806707.1 transcriptional regulator with XRE-family HTH domain [Chryseobacterium defluvii]
MSKLKEIREQHHLTQEELAESSGISVRTIQRIEAGTIPKGHTLRVLAKTLQISEDILQNIESGEENQKIQEEPASMHYSLIKIINLSSLPCILLPPLNILVPLLLMFTLKQKNILVKQIISLQIIWTVLAPIIFMLGIFLKLGRSFTLVLMIGIVLSNVFIIIRNAFEIDRNKKLHYRLNFNMI